MANSEPSLTTLRFVGYYHERNLELSAQGLGHLKDSFPFEATTVVVEGDSAGLDGKLTVPALAKV